MLWFKIVTKTIHKFLALFVLLYICSVSGFSCFNKSVFQLVACLC